MIDARLLGASLALLLALDAQKATAADAVTWPDRWPAQERPMTETEMWAEAGRAADDLGEKLTWVEIAFPDLRLQTPARLGDDVDALVVSWPVYVASLGAGPNTAWRGAGLFVEPQFPTHAWAVRGLAGVRAFGLFHGFGAALEAGGLLGTDGSGAFAGGGPAIGDASGMITALARRTFVGGAGRWDFTLELSIPMRPLTELLD